jgi:hypothetical protein
LVRILPYLTACEGSLPSTTPSLRHVGLRATLMTSLQIGVFCRNRKKYEAFPLQLYEAQMAEAEFRNFTINFGPQHPAAHGVLRSV